MNDVYLKVENISFSYPDVLALDNVSFGIDKGEILGLIGANGAGKTTAILNIIKFLKPEKGKIFLGGLDIGEIKNDSFPVSYIADDPIFYDELTVLEHLHFIKTLYPQNILVIEDLIDKLELNGDLRKVPSALSKGTKQKLSIAMALLREYELLIGDEPFTGLDPKQINIFKETLLKCKKEGKAVLLSTHLLDMVEGFCDRYLMLNRGQVIAYGSQEEIIKANKLKENLSLEEVYLALIEEDK